MYVKFKIFYNHFNGVSFYSIFGEKKCLKNGQFLEIFQILTLRAAASIFFVCLAYWRKIHVPSILTSQAP